MEPKTISPMYINFLHHRPQPYFRRHRPSHITARSCATWSPENSKAMSTLCAQDPATSNSALSAANELKRIGYARIIHALNGTDPNISEANAPIAAIDSSVFPPCKVYHSTGIQTQPLCDGFQFKEIFGREPTRFEFERSIGSAGIGRYSNVFEVKPHELLYGAAFQKPRKSKIKATSIDSGFQTASFEHSKKALTRAKVKTLMTANKYRRIAEEAGYKIWAESNEGKVLHSEQYETKIELDSMGNVKGERADGSLIPNIYGAPIEPDCITTSKITEPCVSASQTDYWHVQKGSDSRESLVTHCLAFPTTYSAVSQDDSLRPVAAHAPSTKDTDFCHNLTEQYGHSYTRRGPKSRDIKEKGLMDGVFVVCERNDMKDQEIFELWDGTESTASTLPEKHFGSLSFPRKRMINEEASNGPEHSPHKRTKVFDSNKVETFQTPRMLEFSSHPLTGMVPEEMLDSKLDIETQDEDLNTAGASMNPEPRPRRVRAEIKRYDPRERIKQIAEAKTSDARNVVQDKRGASDSSRGSLHARRGAKRRRRK
ncbi:hypothetical protein BKA66DRAFT_454302 [Pyrenochaeta sp. MPI-SDFR-AT-0127]|nr:hypothetical protein BKA66DRAFT_454302 [Pyrenochaeta sp. MPI-SDFR-AT-0127]